MLTTLRRTTRIARADTLFGWLPDLSVDPVSDVALLVLAWKLRAKRLCVFSRCPPPAFRATPSTIHLMRLPYRKSKHFVTSPHNIWKGGTTPFVGGVSSAGRVGFMQAGCFVRRLKRGPLGVFLTRCKTQSSRVRLTIESLCRARGGPNQTRAAAQNNPKKVLPPSGSGQVMPRGMT